MEWSERINSAIDYIEDHLTDDIDLNKAASEAFCSVSHFQRIFSVVVGVPLGEYIRRRRLSLAAREFSSGNSKVIDVARKYGYESPDAFTRAFRNVYDVTPMAVRKSDCQLADYPRISFPIILKGGSSMEYKIVEKPAFQVIVGKERKFTDACRYNPVKIPPFWGEFHSSEARNTLFSLNPGQGGPISGAIVLGISIKENEPETFNYLIGIENASGEVPGGFKSLQIPAAKWAIFESRAEYPTPDVFEYIFRKYPTCGYESAGEPMLEVYLPQGGFQVWVSIIDNGN